jgi:carbonic anhydrase
MQPSSTAAKLYKGDVTAVLPEKLLGMEWLFQIDQEEDIPACLKDTPIGVLLREQNLGHAFETESTHPELVIGMCIDFRKQLSVPKDWAYIIRREGANMDGSEFAIALGLSKGIRYMALIAHNDCAMANTAEHQDGFVKALVGKYGWSQKKALDFFIEHARSKDIGNEVDFVLEEAARIEKLFPGITVVPLLMRVENDKLYLIYDWLADHDSELLGKKREAIVDTGHFTPIMFER